MSICTAAQAVSAAEYWIGYKEKASNKYVSKRDQVYFETDAGSANYTYAGYLCGINPGAWCAMQVTTDIYEACGNDRSSTKTVLHGIWPYSSCDQLYDAAPAASKGRRGSWTPVTGDVIIFSDNGSTRSHTGLVYACDGTYVYTIEGNSSNMCRKRSYLLTSSYIWGYVRPAYTKDSSTKTVTTGDLYGSVVDSTLGLHELSKGCAGPEVKTVQRILYAYGFKDDSNNAIDIDGDFGKNTKAAVIKMQAKLGVTQDGIVGKNTWKAMLTALE